MKRIIALLLTMAVLLSSCANPSTQLSSSASQSASPSINFEISKSENTTEGQTQPTLDATPIPAIENDITFASFNDAEFLPYLEDEIFGALEYNPDFYIESITTAYISQEYLDEMAFNSSSNIYFGYTLTELDEHFGDARYTFTLDENGKTTVTEVLPGTDNITPIIKNVAIGTGVILVCVTVTVATGGFGATFVAGSAVSTVNLMFATAATSATVAAASGAAIGGLGSGIISGLQGNDWDTVLNDALFGASESFKWGAIIGAGTGLFKGAVAANAANKFTGGRYSDIHQKGVGDTVQTHHMPANSTTSLATGDGPSINMAAADHKMTASWGSSADAQAYRDAQKALIDQGRVMDAFQMDVDDIVSKFGNKYDSAISQAKAALEDMISQGVKFYG